MLEIQSTIRDLVLLISAAVFLFLVVIPAILWVYDRIRLARRRRRAYRAMIRAVSNHLISVNDARKALLDGPH